MQVLGFLGLVLAVDMDQFGDLVPKNEFMPTNASSEFAAMLGQTPVKTAMKVVSTEEIDDHAWYAAAAICPNDQLNNWSCKSCKKVPGSGANLVHFWNDTAQTKGFVLVRMTQSPSSLASGAPIPAPTC
ncbi:hypothetical protein DSO57_1039394 [Entomophthora muscae]|uniref:Uncharacterized protein n=1 Tax=Entomophthora muscae TaxID=34485 RepID=A0ACC2RD80_9FUNG|nr:hypothetical protein DSO57_1039394 [Entomophthora muscae]